MALASAVIIGGRRRSLWEKLVPEIDELMEFSWTHVDQHEACTVLPDLQAHRIATAVG